MSLCCSAGAGRTQTSLPPFLKTTRSTISLVRPSTALPFMVASFPGQCSNPQGLAAGAAIIRGVYMSENVLGYK